MGTEASKDAQIERYIALRTTPSSGMGPLLLLFALVICVACVTAALPLTWSQLESARRDEAATCPRAPMAHSSLSLSLYLFHFVSVALAPASSYLGRTRAARAVCLCKGCAFLDLKYLLIYILCSCLVLYSQVESSRKYLKQYLFMQHCSNLCAAHFLLISCIFLLASSSSSRSHT